MPRRVFYSFHFKADNWRAAQVRNMGVVDGNQPANDNDWENVIRRGEAGIARWIDSQLNGTSCTIVLIGNQTANRQWINYEIIKSWNDRKGILGIYIHNLKDRNQNISTRGSNPFDFVSLKSGTKLSNIVKTYDPFNWDSSYVYNQIRSNLSQWIEEAITIRSKY